MAMSPTGPEPDQDRVAELDVGVLDRLKAGRDHVREHGGLLVGDTLGDAGEVPVGVVAEKRTGEDAVGGVGVLPAVEHAAGVGGVPGLRLERAPLGCHRRYDDDVADGEVGDHAAGLDDFGDGFVAEDHVGALA
jgi:hypothetical protein